MDLSGLQNLFQNRLFLQYLSGAGGAMSAGQPVGSALNQITQQNIGAQSQAQLNKQYMENISKMFGGGAAPAGYKLTRDEKGTKIEIPAESAGTQVGGGGTPAAAAPVAVPPTGMGQVENINPFR